MIPYLFHVLFPEQWNICWNACTHTQIKDLAGKKNMFCPPSKSCLFCSKGVEFLSLECEWMFGWSVDVRDAEMCRVSLRVPGGGLVAPRSMEQLKCACARILPRWLRPPYMGWSDFGLGDAPGRWESVCERDVCAVCRSLSKLGFSMVSSVSEQRRIIVLGNNQITVIRLQKRVTTVHYHHVLE